MFKVRGRTIQISAGDTGILRFELEGVVLTKKDRGVFTVSRRSGQQMMRKIIEPDQKNVLKVPFVNEDTQGWRPDGYEWDMRIVLDAKMNAGGDVVDGREVITPLCPGALNIVKVVGKV